MNPALSMNSVSGSRKSGVKIVIGSPRNIKITTKEDLKLAEALL